MVIYKQGLGTIFDARTLAGRLERIYSLRISSGNPLTTKNTLILPFGRLLESFSTVVQVIFEMDIYKQGLRQIFDTRTLAGVLRRRDSLRVCSGKPLTTRDTPHLAFSSVMRLPFHLCGGHFV